MKITNCFYDGSHSGFGDFLRGSIHLFNYCKKNQVPFDINISKHKISEYFEPIKGSEDEFEIYDLDKKAKKITKKFKVSYFHILKKLIDKSINAKEKNKYIFSNYDEGFLDKGDIDYFNSIPNLSYNCARFFQNKLKFSKEINDSVYSELEKAGLKAGYYNIVHFRLGDTPSFFKEQSVKEELRYNNLLKIILRKYILTKKPVVVLSDSNQFKNFLLKHKGSTPIYIFHTNSSHMQKDPSGFGNNLKIDDSGIFYAVFDMKMATLAESIDSYSVYRHGSGFVYWISRIFGVPIKMHFLEERKINS